MDLRGNPGTPGLRSITRTGESVRDETGAYVLRHDWTDEALMHAIATRDNAAFSVLYDRYVDLVYSASLRFLADPGLAEDATQDVFVRIWRRPESFIAERGKFVSWLMSVVRNRSVDEIRARGRRRTREVMVSLSPDEPGAVQVVAEGEDPLASAQLKEEQAAVRHALGALPADQRIALELAYFGGLTQQEIAHNLHEPLGTIKTRIRLGMRKLRVALQESL